ncbi:MAG: hypothetical protein LBM38_02070 [Clostridiales bacterium]|jgi:hypothetical protein|nr:hypothetical protein [Clostridiales bacterium]
MTSYVWYDDNPTGFFSYKFSTINSEAIVESSIAKFRDEYEATIKQAQNLQAELFDTYYEYTKFYKQFPVLSRPTINAQLKYYDKEVAKIEDDEVRTEIKEMREEAAENRKMEFNRSLDNLSTFVDPLTPAGSDKETFKLAKATHVLITKYAIAKDGIDYMSKDIKRLKRELKVGRSVANVLKGMKKAGGNARDRVKVAVNKGIGK